MPITFKWKKVLNGKRAHAKLVPAIHCHFVLWNIDWIACCLLYRLGNVEVRFQETADAFEQARLMAKKTKSDFEKIKKER